MSISALVSRLALSRLDEDDMKNLSTRCGRIQDLQDTIASVMFFYIDYNFRITFSYIYIGSRRKSSVILLSWVCCDWIWWSRIMYNIQQGYILFPISLREKSCGCITCIRKEIADTIGSGSIHLLSWDTLSDARGCYLNVLRFIINSSLSLYFLHTRAMSSVRRNLLGRLYYNQCGR